MAARIFELLSGSRDREEGDKSSLLLSYWIDRTNSDTVALALLKATAPSSYEGMVRKICKLKAAGPTQWEGTATYEGLTGENKTPEPSGEAPPPIARQFDSTGGTFKITQSKNTIGRFSWTGRDPAPDLKGAIGWNGKDVEGCDQIVPQWNFSETYHFTDASVTQEYIGQIYKLTGTVNSNQFRYLKPGEGLLFGASGSQKRIGDDWEVTFKFGGSPNLSPIPDLHGAFATIDKKGWEHMTVVYGWEVDPSNEICKQPRYVYIDQIYNEADWGPLGIGS